MTENFPKAVSEMRPLLVAAEALRLKDGRKGEGRFSIDELHYRTRWYKNLRYGSKGSVTREQVLHLAELLECTTEWEANNLLLAAGFQPLHPKRSEAGEAYALRSLKALLERLPGEAILIAKDWSVLDANQAMLDFYGISRELFDLGVSTGRAHILRQLFGPEEPVRQFLLRTVGQRGLDAVCDSNIRSFKRQTALAWEEQWHKDIVQKLKATLPADFGLRWEAIQTDTVIAGDGGAAGDMAVSPPGRQTFHMTTGDGEYPLIVMYTERFE